MYTCFKFLNVVVYFSTEKQLESQILLNVKNFFDLDLESISFTIFSEAKWRNAKTIRRDITIQTLSNANAKQYNG